MLKLIQGDKRNPSYTLALDSASGISLSVEGSDFSAAKKDVLFSGKHTGRDGQRRINTTRDNAEIKLKYRINGGDGPARLVQLQRDLSALDLNIREYEENGRGTPTYLAYRLNDDLDLPEPVFGQFSLFARVLHIDVPNWAGNAATPSARKMVWDTAAVLTVAPYAEGHQQTCGTATGGIKVDPQWGIIPLEEGTGVNKTVNLFLNPSFGHSTPFNSWSTAASAGSVDAEQVTSDTRSYDSAYRISHQGTSGVGRMTQSYSTSSKMIMSCYARKGDGTAPTSSDFVMYGASAAVTTYYIDNKDGWYRCYGFATGGGSSQNYGVEVKTARTIIVDDLQFEEAPTGTGLSDDEIFPQPFVDGNYLGCEWVSTAHASDVSIPKDGSITWDLTHAFRGQFTVSGWFTPTAIVNGSGSSRGCIWSYDRDSDTNSILLYYETVSNDYAIGIYKDGNSQTATSSAIAPNTPIHLLVVQDGDSCDLYLNGSSVATVSSDGGYANTGVLSLGNNNSNQTADHSLWAVDGLRVWDQSLTSTQITQLYNNEKDVKSNGDILGMPPFVWTYDGSGKIENDMDTSGDDYNWAVIGGITGDLPAKAEMKYTQVSYQVARFFIGRRAIPYADPANMRGLWWYKSLTTTAESPGERFHTTKTLTAPEMKIIEGKSRLLITAISSPTGAGITNTYTARVGAGLNNTYVWDSKSYDSSGSSVTFGIDISDVVISANNYQGLSDEILLERVTPTVYVDPVMTGNWEIDGIVLLPYPVAMVDSSATGIGAPGSASLYISEGQAVGDAGAGDISAQPYEGDIIDILPGSMNWLFHFWVESTAYEVSDFVNLSEMRITPRFNLLGGPIA